mgnify:CR=1 FL=1
MYTRNDRLNALFLVEISIALKSVKDPGLSGFLTVTGVELSQDRKVATVYYSVFGETEQKQSTTLALKRAAKFVRHVMTKRLSLRVIPEIVFKTHLAGGKIVFVPGAQSFREKGISQFHFLREASSYAYVLIRAALHRWGLLTWF